MVVWKEQKSHFPLTISATKNSLTDTIKIFKVEGS